MSKLRVNAFTVSADGFGAGLDQGRDRPLGRGAEELHRWFVPTRTFQRDVLKRDGGTTGIDNDFAVRSFENLRHAINRCSIFHRDPNGMSAETCTHGRGIADEETLLAASRCEIGGTRAISG